jgi:long-chain acyl-CoA synthetase
MEKPWLKFYEPDVPETIDIPEIPLYQLLDDTTKEFPDNILTAFMGIEKTYKQIQEELALSKEM